MLLIEENGKLTAAGETLHDQAIAANPDRQQLIAVLVSADWLGEAEEDYHSDVCILPGYIWRNKEDGSVNFWNGFLQPLFARPEAERLVAAQQRLVADDQEGIYQPMRFDGDTLVTGVEPIYADEVSEPETCDGGILVNGIRLWGIGDGWTWTDVGDTLERGDPFHAWLAAQKRAGAKLGSPVGNPQLLERFRAENAHQ